MLYAGEVWLTVCRRDAAAERTRMYLPRVRQILPGYNIYLIQPVSEYVLSWIILYKTAD